LEDGEAPYSSDFGIVLDGTFFSNPLSFDQWDVNLTDASGCTTDYWYAWPPEQEDGFCDPFDIEGCMQPSSPNYHPFANVPAPCEMGDLVDMVYNLTDLISEDDGGFGLTDDSAEINPDWDFTVFPNPLNNGEDVQIELIQEEYEAEYSLRCYDMSGKMVFNQLIQSQNELSQISFPSLSQLQTGIYLIILTDEKGSQQQEILINTR
jgi:hypothetical protein